LLPLVSLVPVERQAGLTLFKSHSMSPADFVAADLSTAVEKGE
jgi:hypothetical protein